MMVETFHEWLPAFLIPYANQAMALGESMFGSLWPSVAATLWAMIKTFLVIAPLLGLVAYTTLAERKIIGWMQVRMGPNRVGPLGLLQPLADGLKVLLKEIILPAKADRVIYFLAPVFSFAPALIAWAVIPFNDFMVVANVNASLLFVLAVTSISVYGIILAGWASNSRYAFLGAMRSAAQMISYEIAMGLSLVVVLMISHSLNLGDIVRGQGQGMFSSAHGAWSHLGLKFLSWNFIPLFPMFIVYLTSIFAECNRAPFDLAEGESEIIGYHVEYSGMAFAVFQLAEYSAMLLGSVLVSLLFLGGWLSPVAFLPDSMLWLIAKSFMVVILFFWVRATFPRYRYDQLMRLGWKVFIPVCLAWLLVIGCWMVSPWNIWK